MRSEARKESGGAFHEGYTHTHTQTDTRPLLALVLDAILKGKSEEGN
jgi:hypothetical protein